MKTQDKQMTKEEIKNPTRDIRQDNPNWKPPLEGIKEGEIDELIFGLSAIVRNNYSDSDSVMKKARKLVRHTLSIAEERGAINERERLSRERLKLEATASCAIEDLKKHTKYKSTDDLIKEAEERERERIMDKIKNLKHVEYYKFYIGKNPADKKYKVYLKTEMDSYIDEILSHKSTK